MGKPDADQRLIVIGASAGGIEALSTLVSTLPDPFPAPIVIAQHLDPRHQSHLDAILSRHTSLPIRMVGDATKLETGVIYLVPADRHAEITDHEVTTRISADRGPKPSVDLLMRSAARSFGEQCVAVILTGSGSDGTAGAQAVKEAGGTVVIQDPASASFPSMPRSLAPTTVDVVAQIGEMGDVLHRIVSAPPRAEDEAAEVDKILERLAATNGLDFGAYKRPTILRRLRGRMTAAGQPDVRTYARYLASDPDEHRRLVSSFLIKVTTFFRDPKVMTYLRETVLPDLVRTARQTHKLRLWSAGCATGEEAYSLAIMVAEVLGADLPKVQVRIFATDVDEDALAFARRGIYARSALNSLSVAQRGAHFSEVDGEFEVSKQIRSMVVFGQHDLGVRAPFPRLDLILCRNVLIYFTRETQERALSVFAYSLRAGGRLILGGSESLGRLAGEFTVENQQLKVYQGRGDRHVLDGVAFQPPRRTDLPQPTNVDRLIATTRLERDRRRTSLERSERLLNELPVGVAVVDRRFATTRINGVARALLEIHGPALGMDLIHLTDVLPATELRSAIKSALAGRPTEAVHRVSSADLPTDEVRHVRLTAAPHRSVVDGEIDGALLVIMDVSAAEHDRSATDALTQKLDLGIHQQQRLIEANRDLAAANDELRLANEDFLFNAEEAQAAREEMETLAEEMQATNEELETLNEELQATNEELETANDELAAQATELSEQRAGLATGRDRLASIFEGMGDAMLVVDRDGATVVSNGAYERLFGTDGLVLADEAGVPLPHDAWPHQRAREGKQFRMEFTVRDQGDGDGGASRRWFEATGRRITFPDERWTGIVVIRDITDRNVRRLEEGFVAAASHELRTPIAALHGYTQLVVRRLDAEDGSDDKARAYAMSAVAQTKALGILVDRLFDMSGVAAGRFDLERSVIDLSALAQRVADVVQVLEVDREITVQAPKAPVLVDADAGRLEQVLLGVLSNAIAHGNASRIDVRLRRVRDQAVLTVTDDGRGIAKVEQHKLFDRLQRVSDGHRTSKPGLGLGLSLARQIVTAHGGTIDLRSVEGDGTAVSIRLPQVDSRRHP